MAANAGETNEKISKTMYDFFGAKPSIKQYLQWKTIKKALQGAFTNENYCDSFAETEILISLTTWDRLQTVWKPNLSTRQLQQKLQEKQTLEECKSKWREVATEYNVYEGCEQQVNLHYGQQGGVSFEFFKPVKQLDLNELRQALNEIKVFNYSFELHNTLGREPCQHLRMVCKGIGKHVVSEFIILLKQCGVDLIPYPYRKSEDLMVIVKGIHDVETFLCFKEFLLQEFAEKYNIENKAPISFASRNAKIE